MRKPSRSTSSKPRATASSSVRPDPLVRQISPQKLRRIISQATIQDLFGIAPSSAQNLVKAIGHVQIVGGTHFVDCSSLLGFLDEMAQAESVEDALRQCSEAAGPMPRPAPMRTSLPAELRCVTLSELPANVEVRGGEVGITGAGAEQVIESLLVLAQVLQNDQDSVRQWLGPPPPPLEVDEGLRELLQSLRASFAP